MPDAGPPAAGWLLWPVAGLYGGVIRARNLYYDRARSAVQRAPVPVISIGNITVGGTGKTPAVIECVRRLHAMDATPAILTRGYRAAPGETADEVLEFRASLPNVPVVVDPDRVAGAQTAADAHHANCVVLDDGFQHRRLARNLDIVLIDALSPWGGGHMLPTGRLREPLTALRRADLLVITRVNQVERTAVGRIRERLQQLAPHRPLVEAGVYVGRLVDRDEEPVSMTELVARGVVGVCGIGNPATFEKLLSEVCGPVEVLHFADHKQYTSAHVQHIQSLANGLGAAWVVTTRKDWVKLSPLWSAQAPGLVRLDVRMTFEAGADVLDARLRQIMEGHC